MYQPVPFELDRRRRDELVDLLLAALRAFFDERIGKFLDLLEPVAARVAQIFVERHIVSIMALIQQVAG